MLVCIKLRYKKTQSKKDAQIENFKYKQLIINKLSNKTYATHEYKKRCVFVD